MPVVERQVRSELDRFEAGLAKGRKGKGAPGENGMHEAKIDGFAEGQVRPHARYCGPQITMQFAKASREDRRKAQKNGVFRGCSWHISGFGIYVTDRQTRRARSKAEMATRISQITFITSRYYNDYKL